MDSQKKAIEKARKTTSIIHKKNNQMKPLDPKHHQHYFSLFRDFMTRTGPMSDENWKRIQSVMKIWSVPKGVRLLDYMEVESALRFLGKGIVKCEDHYNNKSFIYDFRVAPVVVSEMVSFLNNHPSRITLETCTECEFVEVPREALLQQISTEIEMAISCSFGVANYLGMTHYKQALLRTLNAEGRYKQFIKEFPTVALECKLEDVASYLNVSPGSLSRIRKNITWEKDELELEALSDELAVVHGMSEK